MNSEHLHLEVADRAKRLEILKFFRSKGFTLPWKANSDRDYFSDYTYLVKETHCGRIVVDITYYNAVVSYFDTHVTVDDFGMFTFTKVFTQADFNKPLFDNYEQICDTLEYIYNELYELKERLIY